MVTETAGEGTDTVNTDLASYTLGANVENLNYTGAGNFAGTGNALANVIIGGAGNDTLDDGGVGGADTMNGGAGNDTSFVRNAGEISATAASRRGYRQYHVAQLHPGRQSREPGVHRQPAPSPAPATC